MATNIRYSVLTTRIPADGFGRQITSTERKRLAALGVDVPARTRVLRAHAADYIGALYRPIRDYGIVALGISVTLA